MNAMQKPLNVKVETPPSALEEIEPYSPDPEYIQGYFAAWDVFQYGTTTYRPTDFPPSRVYLEGYKQANKDIDKHIGLKK